MPPARRRCARSPVASASHTSPSTVPARPAMTSKSHRDPDLVDDPGRELGKLRETEERADMGRGKRDSDPAAEEAAALPLPALSRYTRATAEWLRRCLPRAWVVRATGELSQEQPDACRSLIEGRANVGDRNLKGQVGPTVRQRAEPRAATVAPDRPSQSRRPIVPAISRGSGRCRRQAARTRRRPGRSTSAPGPCPVRGGAGQDSSRPRRTRDTPPRIVPLGCARRLRTLRPTPQQRSTTGSCRNSCRRLGRAAKPRPGARDFVKAGVGGSSWLARRA